ncbi:MAG TPA: hypothetical protein PK684_09935, partial [Bacillota bacterium]|nr:hypothetical protein [Bacillota bacterium]
GETLILLSMLNQIIVDDLVEENRLDLFEQKKRWHDLWQRQMKQYYGLEGDLLGWEQLKERVVEWLKDEKAYAGRGVMLEMCCSFKPYDELPANIQASPEAQEISLEKIYRLLGFEDRWQELFQSKGV